jgi:hypothetical protein
MSWTSLIDPLVTSKAELEALVFSRGVHLESKELAFRQYDMKTELTAFVADGAQNEDMESMREQLASLAARFNGRGGRNGRGCRGGGRSSTPTDHITETRTCYECGKPGHVRPNCPDLPRNKKRNDNSERQTDHAGSAVAFVASFPALYAASTSDSTLTFSEFTWVIDSGASRHCSVNLSNFTDLKTSIVGNVNGIVCEVKGVGDIGVTVCNRARLPVTITLKEVLYVPDLKERSKGSYLRLLSVRRASQVGCHCNFSKDEGILDLLAGPLVLLVRYGGLVWLPNFRNPPPL